ncbi:MAG TPA: hypothetical protein VHA53_00540 [Nitrolancea sp.]|nr:hypothetical protein [Nitrolancea sp.]
MPASVKIIHVKPGSELDQLLENADDTPIELEKNGVRYRVNRVEPRTESTEQSADSPHHDSILNIIGIGASDEETDVAQHKHEYLADAAEATHEP